LNSNVSGGGGKEKKEMIQRHGKEGFGYDSGRYICVFGRKERETSCLEEILCEPKDGWDRKLDIPYAGFVHGGWLYCLTSSFIHPNGGILNFEFGTRSKDIRYHF